MRKKWRLVPVELWQLAKMESWLNEQAQYGWQLVKLNGLFATFEQSSSPMGQYRIVITKEADTIPTNVAQLEQAGWDYIVSHQHYHIFYSQQFTAATDVLPDLASQAESFAKITKKTKQQLLLNGVFLIIFGSIFFMLFNSTDTPIRNLIEGKILSTVLFVVGYIINIIQRIFEYLAQRRLQQQLEQADLMDYQTDWRGEHVRKVFWNVGYIAIVILIGLMLWKELNNLHYQTLPKDTESLHLLRLHMIEKTELLTREEFIAEDVDWYNFMEQRWTLLAPKQYKVNETMMVQTKPMNYEPRLEFNVIECIVPNLASALFDEFKEYYELENTSLETYGSFDQIAVRQSYDNYVRILTLKDKRVQYVSYWGEADIQIILQALNNL